MKKKSTLLLCLIVSFSHMALYGQQNVQRIMRQDSTLNNLIDPPGYQTAVQGTLGGVEKVGIGTQPMILIPGLGFSGKIFSSFMEAHANKYRMYAVTLPGFGGTAALASPGEQTSFGDQTWTNSALAAIEKLMADEHIEHPIIVGHWLTGTQLALRLALKHPKGIKAVVLLSGSARLFLKDTAFATYYGTLEKRVRMIDKGLVPRWFKTVTRETWDDNNFLPGDYAVNQVLGLRLWREAATPKLHVWVRYLNEFNAQDIGPELAQLKVPMLLLEPGLEELSFTPGQNYMENYCVLSWKGYIEDNPSIIIKTIPNSRICMWYDNPEAVYKELDAFLQGKR